MSNLLRKAISVGMIGMVMRRDWPVIIKAPRMAVVVSSKPNNAIIAATERGRNIIPK